MNKIWLVLLLLGVVLMVGCQKEETVQPVDTATDDGEGDPFERFRTGQLDILNDLALGTLLLEDSEDAVTPEQAADLLPLWKVIQSGSLKSQAETDAVLKQIEGKMTDSQIKAIEGMELTRESITTWMEDQDLEMPQFGAGDGSGRGGGFGQMGDMSEEERAEMREQFQAMRDLSPEERRERLAEMGFEVPEGAGEGSPAEGGIVMLTRNLIAIFCGSHSHC